ncbi:hypothetical protein BGX34_005991 [Mortierella sp. NVP85]|nr:hypothetical protein BGX34_005991 [Mortierella sp. NVP85]
MPPAASQIKILIVGAGIAGLTLAILLERANIAYEILERHQTHTPLGSAICLIPSVQPLLQQLGLLDEIKRRSKPFGAMVFREENLEIIGTFSSKTPLDIQERYGDYAQIISRKDLCAILADHVPQHKIKFGKRVLEIRQNTGEVIVQCSDKSVYHADILVGADGAYSAVRQCLHNSLDARGLLPKHDTAPMGYQYDCLVGVTDPMDPHVTPALSDTFSEFQTILSKDLSIAYWCIPLPENRMSWMVVKYHDKGKKHAEETIFKQSDWGEDAAELMGRQYRDLRTSYGYDLGYMMDRTPKEATTKVMLEEKFYMTWYNGRVVLAGDGKLEVVNSKRSFNVIASPLTRYPIVHFDNQACHKVVPFGGQGANQSIHDVLTLANLLVDLKDNTLEDIGSMFETYYKERAPVGRAIVQVSSRAGDLMNRKPAKDPTCLRFLHLSTIKLAVTFTVATAITAVKAIALVATGLALSMAILMLYGVIYIRLDGRRMEVFCRSLGFGCQLWLDIIFPGIMLGVTRTTTMNGFLRGSD